MILTTTEFNVIWSENNLNDHFNTKKAAGSTVYKINFKDRENFSQELVMESDPAVVYHDFCKVWEKLYAVGWEFWKKYWTARMVQVYPKVEKKDIYSSSEIRIRDCEMIEENDNKYIWMVSHWVGGIEIYDENQKKIIYAQNTSFEWIIDDEIYSWVTMIHEVISWDLDSDGNKEFYFTPTSANWKTHIDQKWKIFQTKQIDNKWETKEFISLWDAYAKEIHKLVLKNGKEILLTSVQGKTVINEEKEKNTKPRVSFTFLDGSKKEIKDENLITDIIRPTVLQATFIENGVTKNKNLWKIDVVQCRVVETGDVYRNNINEINVIVGCNNGEINIYALDNDLNLTLKDTFQVEGKQVHSFYLANTDDDSENEIFVGIDFDGFYHLDLSEEEKLFKMYDYQESETWLWAIEWIK